MSSILVTFFHRNNVRPVRFGLEYWSVLKCSSVEWFFHFSAHCISSLLYEWVRMEIRHITKLFYFCFIYIYIYTANICPISILTPMCKWKLDNNKINTFAFLWNTNVILSMYDTNISVGNDDFIVSNRGSCSSAIKCSICHRTVSVYETLFAMVDLLWFVHVVQCQCQFKRKSFTCA